MEEERLLRKKKKALNGSNKGVLAEACNALASFYYKHNRFEDALDEYKEEAAIYKAQGLRLEWGTCNRMIGEMYLHLDECEKALKYEEIHLSISKELNDLVEEQRAMATLGRIYLNQGQSTTSKTEAVTHLKAAEKAFMKSLVLCERLKDKEKNKRELMDMRARLLLNIGVVQEELGNLEKAVDCIKKAISICSNQELYDVLHLCYLNEALIFGSKHKDYPKALSSLNKALEVAKRLEDKILKQCETLCLKSDILCKMNDYHSAKQILLKAWKLKTPDSVEAEKIESKLKVVAAMCYTEDLVKSTNPTDYNSLKKLYEKLGDGACHLQNYANAVEHYLKTLQQAELAGDSGKALLPIYVSLYQTYKDLGHYNDALEYYEKEYELIKDVPKEAYTTLVNIADTMFLARKPYDQIEKTCRDAREAAQNCHNRKYEINTLRSLLKYQDEYGETDKMEETKSELRLLGIDDFDNMESSEDDQSVPGTDADVAQIGDDICLDDLTDLSNDEEEAEVTEKTRSNRKRGRAYMVKHNLKGETQLHTACILGNRLLVERLLANGHPVNIRDNAGWTPLHEACIHGHLDVVNMLVSNGASINDRGGCNCDGITPLHDAASNGHLEVVQFLLNKGAIPSLKTDLNETVLQILQKWRTRTILTKDEETLYKSICAKINNLIDNTPIELNIRSKSKTPVKKAKDISPPSTSKCIPHLRKSDSPRFKKIAISDGSDEDELPLNKRNQIAFPSDSESNDSTDSREKIKEKSSVKEYRDVISALRNKNIIDDYPEVDVRPKPKSALLDPDDVGDDWLEDDMGISKKRKRLSDPLTMVTTKKPRSFKNTIEDINKFNDPSLESLNKSKRNSFIEIDDESSSDSYTKNENIYTMNFNNILNESKTHDSRKNMKKRFKQQSSLLKAGFQRKVMNDLDNSSNSASDNEITQKKKSSTPTSFSRYSSFENSIPNQDGFNVVQGLNPNILQPMNVIQPINIVQPARKSKNGMTQILPPAAVKVQVEDKVLLISLKLDTINKLTISWLVEEIKSRYYKLTGVRPIFSLMTSDGAILCEDDPLSLVLSSPELKTCISTFKASPAEERYLECCEALGIPPTEEMQQVVARSHTTHRVALGSETLSTSQVRPLFRALTHQTHITSIMISNNNLSDDSFKYLIECVSTLKQLSYLDVSFNNISADGIKNLINAFEKTNRPICQSLDHIDFSSNPISNEGFLNICKLTKFIKLKVIKINNCKINSNVFNDANKPVMDFDSLEVLDVGNNEIGFGILSSIIQVLNPNLIVELDLDNVGVGGNICGVLAPFLDSAKQVKLRRFNLSSCKLVDGQFMRVFRSLGRATHLQSITLKNNLLTFITLKKLLQRQPPVPQINLEGCQDIFKYSPDSDFHVWLPAVDFGRCIPEINVTPVSKTDEERDSLKSFQKTWFSCFKSRGIIERGDGGLIRFTAK